MQKMQHYSYPKFTNFHEKVRTNTTMHDSDPAHKPMETPWKSPSAIPATPSFSMMSSIRLKVGNQRPLALTNIGSIS